jgi:hypothetical protein
MLSGPNARDERMSFGFAIESNRCKASMIRDPSCDELFFSG